MQWDKVAHIGRGSLQPGDLVFYSGLGHVGIYVGSGKVIHAPTFGESVKLASVDMMARTGTAGSDSRSPPLAIRGRVASASRRLTASGMR